MNKQSLLKATRAAAVAVAIAHAGSAAAQSQAVMIAEPGFETQEQGSLRYLSGGIGAREREMLDTAAHGFDLKVVAALDNGSYAGPIELTVLAADETPLIKTTTDGPIFYADLSAGRYHVIGRSAGEVVRSSVDVNTFARANLVLRFKSGAEREPARRVRPIEPPGPVLSREEALGEVSLYDLDPQAMASSRANVQIEIAE